jgi:hypothetical protein
MHREIAARWVLQGFHSRKGSVEELQQAFTKYSRWLQELRNSLNSPFELRGLEEQVDVYMNEMSYKYPHGTPPSVEKKVREEVIRRRSRWHKGQWNVVIGTGQKFIELALGTVTIPKGRAKEVEKAARLFISARRLPLDVWQWLETYEKELNLPAEMVKWPLKGSTEDAGYEETFKIGPLMVHNTIQLEGKLLDETKKVLTKITRLIKSSGIQGADKLIYGDVYIVGKLNQPKVQAWYIVEKDSVWIRYLKDRDLHSGLHEFGHRLYRKFASKAALTQWQTRHRDMMYSDKKVEFPKVGDPFPFPVKGIPNPQVQKVEGLNIYVTENAYFKWDRYRDFVKTGITFPTRYAATNPEEHFCETFALYCQGTLPPEFIEPFEKIFK